MGGREEGGGREGGEEEGGKEGREGGEGGRKGRRKVREMKGKLGEGTGRERRGRAESTTKHVTATPIDTHSATFLRKVKVINTDSSWVGPILS